MLNHHVPKLCPGIVEAGIYLMVNNNTAADTGAKRDHHGICNALGAPGNRFAFCSRICVIFNQNAGNADRLLQLFRNRIITERQVAGIFHAARIAVCNARGSNADICKIRGAQPLLSKKSLAKLCHILYDFPRCALRPRGNRSFSDDFNPVIDKTRCDVCSSKINSDVVHSCSFLCFGTFADESDRRCGCAYLLFSLCFLSASLACSAFICSIRR